MDTRTSRRQLLWSLVAGAATGGIYVAGRRARGGSAGPTGRAGVGERFPTLYLPHGGGPCFFMEWTMGPADTWDRMGEYLRGIGDDLPATPSALLVISAHWERPRPTVIESASPPLLYDYSGFPPHTYELTWPAPGAPELARRVRQLLQDAGIGADGTHERGLDHGVFIPLKLAFPDASIPTLQLSLQAGLDPAAHLALGRALSPLRDAGVFIVGSGMSYHNMAGFRGGMHEAESAEFDRWLGETVALPRPARDARLTAWEQAPHARACHPREEHLLPLMVVAGAAGEDAGRQVYRDRLRDLSVSAVRFG